MKKYLIITGGSRGIGKATIEHFLSMGFHIINISRSQCDVTNVMNINTDLQDQTSVDQCTRMLNELIGDATSICLVHNAASLIPDCVDAISLSNLNDMLTVNVLAPIRINQACLPFMKSGSSIIYIGSALAEIAVAGCASYTISKHALLGLMRATCQDLAAKQIFTVCICPGIVDTKLMRDSMDPAIIDWLTKHKIIGKRLIQPHEIAELIYIAAQQPLLNGKIIHADLGLYQT